MPGINGLGDGLAALRFGIPNEVGGIADAVNREVKAVQVHRMSHRRRIDDPPMDCFTLFVGEMLSGRPRLTVDGEYGISAASHIVSSPFRDDKDTIVLGRSGRINDERAREQCFLSLTFVRVVKV